MARLTRLLAVTRNAWLAWGAWRRETPAHLIGPPVEFATADGRYFTMANGDYFGTLNR